MNEFLKDDAGIADDILNNIKRVISLDSCDLYELMGHQYKKNDNLFFDKKCSDIKNALVGYGLIKEEDERLTLTEKGRKAAELGINKYFRKIDANDILKEAVEKYSISSSKSQIIMAFIAISGIIATNNIEDCNIKFYVGILIGILFGIILKDLIMRLLKKQ